MAYPQQPQQSKPDSGSTFIHSPATITANGSTVVPGVGSKEMTLVVNLTAAPTGTSPTLQFSLQEVDPGDQTAVFGPIVSTAALNSIGVYTLSLGAMIGGAVKVSWTVGGTSPSFSGVYTTASTKVGTAATSTGVVTVTDASVSTNASAAPTSSAQIGGSDGTNLQAARVFDADTGAGTQYVFGVSLRKGASGGSVEAGTSSDPIRVDPTGTTTQPVSGSVSITGTPSVSVSNIPATQPISAVSLPLPSGAATETTLGTRLADSTFTGRINTQGQKTSAASTPVVLASDQSSIPVAATISGTVPVSSTTLALDATLTGGSSKSINRGGAKGATTAADVTSTASGANHQALDVIIYDASGNPITSFGGSGNQGTPNTTANAWPIKVTDGTNVGTVKAASTAAVAADPALVVAVSPNNTVKVDGSAVTQPVSGTITVGNLLTVTPSTGTLANFWFQKITDGTNTAAVKAASTAAVAADPALVVAISPNNTVPVSAASLPLPSGASTAAKQPALGTAGTASADVLTVQGIASMTALKVDGSAVTQPVSGSVSVSNFPATQPVSGSVSVSNFPATQPVSAASLPLPSGASTAAKQPALGTAGTASSDVLTVQGIASMTALKVDGSAVTQPVSGTVTANLGTIAGVATETTLGTRLADATFTARINTLGQKTMANSTPVVLASDQASIPVAATISGTPTVTANIGTSGSLALDATLTGGSQKAIVRGGAKGSTTAADVTSVATGANHQALAVAILDASGNQITSFGSSPTSGTATLSNVTGVASSAQLLAANSSRLGATIYNDSTAALYIKLGTTASVTSFTVRLLAQGYFEVPFNYTGRIDGIWAAATGAARITELT